MIRFKTDIFGATDSICALKKYNLPKQSIGAHLVILMCNLWFGEITKPN